MNQDYAIRLMLAVAIWITAMGAQAIMVTSDTAEGLSFRTCIAGVSVCDSVTAPAAQAYGGLPGALLSSASLPYSPSFGSASGSVTLSGTIGAPILRTLATSVAGARTNTNSVAIQEYTYTGLSTTDRTFGGTLSYTQTITPGGPIRRISERELSLKSLFLR